MTTRASLVERAEDDGGCLELLDTFDIVPLNTVVLERAAEPFPTLVSALDAMHLATALLIRSQVEDLRFATHDAELAIAARAMGFEVLGVAARRRGTHG